MRVIDIGETVSIPMRTVTEEMHDRRVQMGLPNKPGMIVGTTARVLRAYTRPRNQDVLSIQVEEGGVKVTGVRRGFALVDVVDEISDPAGCDYEFYVVRQVEKAPALEQEGV